MREIKYQAYDPANARMLNWEFLKNHLIFPGQLAWYWREYTGLHDSTRWEQLTEQEQKVWLDSGRTREQWNGKEIYEGDIIESRSEGDTAECKDEVFWNEPHLCWGLRDWDFTLADIPLLDMEVIGNIYENPELLGEK